MSNNVLVQTVDDPARRERAGNAFVSPPGRPGPLGQRRVDLVGELGVVGQRGVNHRLVQPQQLPSPGPPLL